MTVFSQVRRRLIEYLTHNFWVRLALWFAGAFIWLIALIANYLEFKNNNLTVLFWALLVLTFVPLLLAGIAAVRQMQKQQQLLKAAGWYYNHQQKIENVKSLIEEFTTFQKAKSLADRITNGRNIRVLSILPVEGEVGVILNIGREENLQVGTQLQIYQIDEYTSDGHPVEQLLGLVEVTYVQAQNNISQAIVKDKDREFWSQTRVRLKQERRIDPPRNFAVPYIPLELGNLSFENLASLIQYLEAVYNHLAFIEDQIVQEEDL